MKRLARRLANWIAPVVCPDCEGGSGVRWDEARIAGRVCATCGGTGDGGDSSTAEQELRERVGEARPPRSAA